MEHRAEAKALHADMKPAARERASALWDELEGLIGTVMGMGTLFLAIAYLSPRFERQADVYAARTIQRNAGSEPPATAMVPHAGPSYVGEYGAGIFASALHRVAVINQIPVDAGEWMHGSIAGRMRALHEMSADPSHTSRFDRVMRRLYTAMIVCLCVFGAWAAVEISRGQPADTSRNSLPLVNPASAAHGGR